MCVLDPPTPCDYINQGNPLHALRANHSLGLRPHNPFSFQKQRSPPRTAPTAPTTATITSTLNTVENSVNPIRVKLGKDGNYLQDSTVVL